MDLQKEHALEAAERDALSIELEALKYYWEQAREYADGQHNNAPLAHGAILNLAKELRSMERRFWKGE